MTREINDFGWKMKAATDNKTESKDIHEHKWYEHKRRGRLTNG